MRMRIAQAAGLVFFIVLSALISNAQNNNIELRTGDVLVGTSSSGQYSVYRNLAPVATISNAGGATAGCGFDASYHPYTTDTTNAAVNRWNVSAIQTPAVPNKVITSRSVPGKSVAFDNAGNVYVGQSGGNGCVAQFGPGFNFKQYLPLACNPKAQGGNNSSLSAGTSWMDLSSDGGTIYFTNTSNSILDFAANCTSTQAKNCVNTLVKITPGSTKLYAIRVLTPDVTTAPAAPGYVLVAGGAQIALVNPGTGSVVQTYTSTGETDFEVLTLLPGGTQFVAGSPANHKLYVFNYSSATPVQTVSSVTGGPTGACTYGLADAAQPQPQAPTVLSSSSAPGAANLPNDGTGGYTASTAAFTDPSGKSKLKVTFNNLGGTGTLAARVTKVPAGSVLSDPAVTASYSSASEGGSFPCTSDGTSCYIWEIEPTGITFDSDDVSQSQTTGVDSTSHLVKNSQLDITTLTGDADPAGHTTISVYSINNFLPGAGGNAQVVCPTNNGGYLSPVTAGQTYNFGSVVPFKFQTAASLADCAAGNFLTNLGNTAYLTIVQENTINNTQAPAAATINTSGNSGTPPIYRLSSPQYILNVDSSNLVPGVCYVATTFSPLFQSFQTRFCLTSK